MKSESLPMINNKYTSQAVEARKQGGPGVNRVLTSYLLPSLRHTQKERCLLLKKKKIIRAQR